MKKNANYDILKTFNQTKGYCPDCFSILNDTSNHVCNSITVDKTFQKDNHNLKLSRPKTCNKRLDLSKTCKHECEIDINVWDNHVSNLPDTCENTGKHMCDTDMNYLKDNCSLNLSNVRGNLCDADINVSKGNCVFNLSKTHENQCDVNINIPKDYHNLNISNTCDKLSDTEVSALKDNCNLISTNFCENMCDVVINFSKNNCNLHLSCTSTCENMGKNVCDTDMNYLKDNCCVNLSNTCKDLCQTDINALKNNSEFNLMNTHDNQCDVNISFPMDNHILNISDMCDKLSVTEVNTVKDNCNMNTSNLRENKCDGNINFSKDNCNLNSSCALKNMCDFDISVLKDNYSFNNSTKIHDNLHDVNPVDMAVSFNCIVSNTKNISHDNYVGHDVHNSILVDKAQVSVDLVANTDNDTLANCTREGNVQDVIVGSDNLDANEKMSAADEALKDDTFRPLREYKQRFPKGVTISYLNINSILNKFNEFSRVMTDALADIVSIAETKIDETVLDAVLSVKNFKLYRCDGTRYSRGLITYVRSDLTHCRRTDLENSDSDAQYIVIEVWLKKQRWFFVSVYKPPTVHNETFLAEMTNICERLFVESTDVIILGDMNIDMGVPGNKLKDFCETLGFRNIILKNTCFKSSNETLIDVILVSKPVRFNETMVFDTGLSDFHKMITVSTKLYAPRRIPRKIIYRSFKNFDELSYREDIKNAPFSIAHIFEDAQDITWCHESLFADIVQSHAPLKSRLLRKDPPPFMNSSLRKVIYRRNQLRNKFWKCKTNENWNKYRSMRNLATKIRRQSEINFFRDRSSIKDSKDFWKCFKPYLSEKNTGNSNTITLKEQDKLITNPRDVCATFSSYYETMVDNIGTKDNFDDPDNLSIKEAISHYSTHDSIKTIKGLNLKNENFNFKCVNNQEVLKQLKKLDTKKAIGYDNISPKLLKIAANELSSSLVQVINVCIQQDVYPEIL